MMQKARPVAGLALLELLVGIGVLSVLLAIALAAVFSLSRSFGRANFAARQINHTSRVMDYIARDLRGAQAASLAGGVLTITLPDYFDVATPRDPVIVDGFVQYGPAPLTVRYFQQGSEVIREVNGSAQVVASSVETFTMDAMQPVTAPGTIAVASRTKSPYVLPKVAIQLVRARNLID